MIKKDIYNDKTWPETNLPVISKYVTEIKNEKEGKNITYFEAVYDDYQFHKPSEEIFMLAHYGLPEPDFQIAQQPSNSTTYLIFFGGAVLCALFAFLVWRATQSRGNSTS